MSHAVEYNRAADHVALTSVSAQPRSLRDEYDAGGAPVDVLLGAEVPTCERWDAQEREERVAHTHRLDRLWVAVASENGSAEADPRHVHERALPRSKVYEIRLGDRVLASLR